MLKDLNFLAQNRSINKMLIIDNRPEGVFLNYENYVPIVNFEGSDFSEFEFEKSLIKDLTNYLMSFVYV